MTFLEPFFMHSFCQQLCERYVYLDIGKCINSSERLVVFPPIVGWGDSTVVGILRRSPASGERVGECVQSGSVSEEQGTSYSISCTCHNAHILS